MNSCKSNIFFQRTTFTLPFASVVILSICSCQTIPTHPTNQDSYSIFFDYHPAFSIGFKINGSCYEGPAVITPVGREKEAPERFDPRLSGTKENIRFSTKHSIKLQFNDCKAPIPPELLDVLGYSHSFVLKFQDHQTEISTFGENNPIRCAEQIDILKNLDACEASPPNSDDVPHACDDRGAKYWLTLNQQKWDRFNACYGEVNAESLEKLKNRSHLAHAACPKLALEASNNIFSDDIIIKLLNVCYDYMEIKLKERARIAIYKRDVMQDYWNAHQGDFRSMYTFYYKYRAFRPDLAESIRHLAMSKFGPTDPERWRRLQKDVESIALGDNRFTICDIQETSVLISANAFQIVRGPTSLGKAPKISSSEQNIIKKIIKKHGYNIVQIKHGCSRKSNYWFFDEE